ncbi:hypothetical protein [Haloarcula marina]|nr:hypothetical protein [Halomicroarcula marina]
MLAQLKRAVTGQTAARVLRECRDCGTAVGADDAHCPACESAEIARYDL